LGAYDWLYDFRLDGNIVSRARLIAESNRTACVSVPKRNTVIVVVVLFCLGLLWRPTDLKSNDRTAPVPVAAGQREMESVGFRFPEARRHIVPVRVQFTRDDNNKETAGDKNNNKKTNERNEHDYRGG